MARNAQMERDLAQGGVPDPGAWEATLEGRKFAEVREAAGAAASSLRILAIAAGFNPKAPLNGRSN